MNRIIHKIALSVAGVALAALPIVAHAQATPNGARGPLRGQAQQQPQQPPPQEEYNEALKFMEANAPHRLAVMQRFTNPRVIENAKWTMVNQKRRFETIKANNADSPEVYQAWLRGYQINDDIFYLCHQILQQPKLVSTIEPQLRAKVQELFDVGIQERQARIDRLEKQLARLRKEVDNDQAKRDELVAKNYQDIRQRGVNGALFPNSANPADQKLAEPPPGAKR